MNRLIDHVVIVTGAGRGIGRAMVDEFVAHGATVVATSRRSESPFGPDIHYECHDVANERAWATLIERVSDRYGHVDGLVNNAGIIAYEPVGELTLNDWQEIVAVNQTGTFLGMRAVLPGMVARRRGSVVNVSSIWGNAAVAGAHAYHATKGAVRNMSKNAAITHAADNVRVNSLHPGFVSTPLTDAQDDAVNEYVVGQTPMGRPGRPEEIARAATFLLSDEASFVTGAELVVDGGYLAQ